MTQTRYAEVTIEEEDYRSQRNDNKLVRWLGRLAQWLVWLIAIVPLFLGKVISAFIGGSGVLAVSAFIFLVGVTVNTNSYWQMIGNYSFLPWYYEDPWTGWGSFGNVVTSLGFLFALTISIGTSVVQGKVIRGKGVEIDKAKFTEWNRHSIPAEPGEDKLRMAKISWRKLKNSGVSQNRTVTYGSIAAWAFEIVVSFAQNNPFRFSDPMLVLGCFIFIIGTSFAPEFGYAMWNDAIDNFKLEDKVTVENAGRAQ